MDTIFNEIVLTNSPLDFAVLSDEVQILQKKVAGKIFVFFGAPGAGKGTQASILSKRLGVVHISTGDLFRDEVRRETEVGKIIHEFMKAGQFVPPEYADRILEDRLGCLDTAAGVILDGFPRSVDHLDSLDEILSRSNLQLAGAIHINVPEAEAIKRISGRRSCPKCKSCFNVHFLPPRTADICDTCGDTLVQREDDKESVVRARFELFSANMKPMLQRFAERDLLFTLTSLADADKTADKIIEILCYPERFISPLSVYEKLHRHLDKFIGQVPSVAEMEALALAFRDQALAENCGKRTGSMRRFVYLLSANSFKIEEFVRVFDRYGVEVLATPPLTQLSAEATELFIQCLLKEKTKLLVPVAVLNECTTLLKPLGLRRDGQPSKDVFGDRLLATVRPGILADHLSILTSWTPSAASGSNLSVDMKQYKHITQGRIRVPAGAQFWTTGPVFGWDDKFEVLATGKTYQEHRQSGLKISSRDMVLSAFLEDKIYYKHMKGLQHSSLRLRRPVDFSVDVADFVSSEPLYNTQLAHEYGLCNALRRVLNEGIFFKAADTRLEANYWQPGLNAGLPLVAKKDPIHEKTFMMHDFGHFLMKDLIFCGTDSPLHRTVYIAARMISEAATIMLADGVFVDTLRRGGVEYDYSTRKIYPLVQATGLDFSDKASFVHNLRLLMKASVDYTLKGDDSSFRSLLAANGVTDFSCLEEYKDKYKPFFVSDYQWTAHNYENMAGRSDELRNWWRITEPIRNLLDLPLETIDEFIALLPRPRRSASGTVSSFQIVDQVFDVIFTRRIATAFEQDYELDAAPIRLRRSFLRYALGQMGVFARFHSFPETSKYLAEFISLVQSDASIDTVRGHYEGFVHLLETKNLISSDDAHNYREIYPLFEPFYVSYDKDEEYPDLGILANRILDYSAHREYQVGLAEAFMQRSLTTPEKRFHDYMCTMIETCGGQVEDGVFVTKPGVSLLACDELVQGSGVTFNAVDAAMSHASFLICGISVETSLELIAHGEAAVARLTSSKTASMSVPLFRVQGAHTSKPMMNYLKSVQRVRTAFERLEDPKKNWACGIEMFNITNAGCKATALVYTMTISDYHKLFIGRTGEAGNECEVREVIHMMTEQLHNRYPAHILTTEQYLGLANGEKYAVRSAFPTTVCLENAAASTAQPVPCLIHVASTRLTDVAAELFQSLGIDVSQTEAHQLAEFRSRITYLAFARPARDSSAYMQKMIREFQHLSVVSACRASVMALGLSSAVSQRVSDAAVGVGGSCISAQLRGDEGTAWILSMNLKQFRKLIAELWAVCDPAADDADDSHSVRLIAKQLAKVLHDNYAFVIDICM